MQKHREKASARQRRVHTQDKTLTQAGTHTHIHSASMQHAQHTKDSSKPPSSHGVKHRHTPPHPSKKKERLQHGDRIPPSGHHATHRQRRDAGGGVDIERESQTTKISRRPARTDMAADNCVWPHPSAEETHRAEIRVTLQGWGGARRAYFGLAGCPHSSMKWGQMGNRHASKGVEGVRPYMRAFPHCSSLPQHRSDRHSSPASAHSREVCRQMQTRPQVTLHDASASPSTSARSRFPSSPLPRVSTDAALPSDRRQ